MHRTDFLKYYKVQDYLLIEGIIEDMTSIHFSDRRSNTVINFEFLMQQGRFFFAMKA